MNNEVNQPISQPKPDLLKSVNYNPQQTFHNSNQSNNMYQFNERRPRRNNILMYIIPIILLIGAGIYGLSYYASKPRIIFAASIFTSYDEISNSINSFRNARIHQLSKDNVVISKSDINFRLDSNVGEIGEAATLFDIFKNINITSTYGIDMQNKESKFNFDATYEGEELLSFELFNKDDVLFFYMEQLFDKYIEIENYNTSSVYGGNEEDIKYLSNKIKNLLVGSLKDSYFVQEEVTIQIDNEDIKTTKNTLNLTPKVINEMSIYMIEGFKQDDKAINALVKFLPNEENKSESALKVELIDELTKVLDELKSAEIEVSENNAYFTLYGYGILNIPIKYELKTSITNYYGFQEEIEIIYIRYKGIKEATIIQDGIELGTLSIDAVDNKQIYTIELNDTLGNPVSIIVCEIIKEEIEITKNKEYETNVVIELSIKDVETNDEIAMTVDVNTKTTIGGSLSMDREIDIVKLDDLTEFEQMIISDNLTNIINSFNPVYTEDTWEDDYNW